MPFTTLTFNTTAKARTRKFQGREYLVAPAVMMTEGVHKGNKGRIRYTSEFLKKNTRHWRNFTPITVYHPKRDGKHVSADDLQILDNHGVGFIRNTRFGKTSAGKTGWKTETWFDKEQTKRVDSRVYNALRTGDVTEVSTGMFLNAAKKKGVWNGKEYQRDARRIQVADHLAVLPDQRGACSVKDGAGLLVNSSFKLRGFKTKDRRSEPVANELSFSDVSEQIRRALAAKNQMPGYSWNGHVVEVFDGYCVYCVYGGSPDYNYTYYRQGYSVKGEKVKLTGEPTLVERKVDYVPVTNSEDNDMAKEFNRKRYINILVNQGGFDDADRAWLQELSDEALQEISGKKKVVANADEDDEEEEPVVNKKKTAKKAKKKVVVNDDPDDDDDDDDEVVSNSKKRKEVTLADLVANADPALRKAFKALGGLTPDSIRELRLTQQREKARAIQTIVANAENIYTEEELAEKPMGELRKLAKAVSVANSRRRDDYEDDDEGAFFGAGGSDPTVNESGDEEDRLLDSPELFAANENRDFDDEDDTPDPRTRKVKKKAKSRS